MSLGVIVAIVALCLDGGRMAEERRRVRTAADAAALAGGFSLYNNYAANHGTDPQGDAKATALASAAANGYDNDGVNSVVTVNIGPASGNFAGQAGYVEVIIQSNIQATFGAAITGSGLSLQGRAVASGQPQNIGLLVLNASSNAALTASGSASLKVNGSIVVNSTSASAISLSGSATLTAPIFDVTGNVSTSGGSSINGTVLNGMPPAADPLRNLAAPSILSYALQTIEDGVTTLLPGIYMGGINLAGGAAVTLQPGLYILLGGGLQLAEGSTLIGEGVCLYSTGLGAIQINGSGKVSLSPPTSGPYQGISIFQDRANSQNVSITASASTNVTGLVYAPSANVTLSVGAGGGTTGGAFICSTLTIAGNATCSVNMGANYAPVPACNLVE
jgi:hypothetical protein